MLKSELKSNISIREGEKGVALVVAIIVVAILSVVALTALAFSTNEVRIAGSELKRMQSHNAAQAGLEKMTNDFSALFRTKMRPSATDIYTIVNSPPAVLQYEGFTFEQHLEMDEPLLARLRAIQNLNPTQFPTVNIPDGPYSGLSATVTPYLIRSKANSQQGAEVELERNFNNYLIPLFQFGMFSNDDIEFRPGPPLTFNGRVHVNGNLYAVQNTTFLDRVTVAGEFVRDSRRDGTSNGNTAVRFNVGGTLVSSSIGMGSVKAGSGFVGGPNNPSATVGMRGFYPGSPNGVVNPVFDSTSVLPVNGSADRFGGMLLTGSTGARKLRLPLELDGNLPLQIIKRSLPNDNNVLATSRYQTKAVIRVFIDDSNAGTAAANVAGIPAGKGILLERFVPTRLGPNVLKQIDNLGNFTGSTVMQVPRPVTPLPSPSPTPIPVTATSVRAIGTTVSNTNPLGLGFDANTIPTGSDKVRGRIYIEIVKPDGITLDVTQEILSLGVTVGEPNGIFYLQRPLWAAFVQGSRDRTSSTATVNLVTMTHANPQNIADGEIGGLPSVYVSTSVPSNFDTADGYLKTLTNDDASGVVREVSPVGDYNEIVPINNYNVREGWYLDDLNGLSRWNVYERGVMSIVDINMRNLARWVDGVYDNNLLSGTDAVSTNIRGDDGYVVYISDRRGDRVKTEYDANGNAYQSTNGLVDNENIYGPVGASAVLDRGEDVINFGKDDLGNPRLGSLQNDQTELTNLGGSNWSGNDTTTVTPEKHDRAVKVSQHEVGMFRRAVRVFNGENLTTTGGAGKLSQTKGITISSENMIYSWGNYNTTGINALPSTTTSTLNNGGYLGPQVPASLVCDAYYPLSKTWFDAYPSIYPGNTNRRQADDNNPSNGPQSTSVRAGIIAGVTTNELQDGSPGRDGGGSKHNGGIHNYPRFSEYWGDAIAFNYTGSFAPLYFSTQMISQWECCTAVYAPPRRNWSFDSTFQDPNRLPPGTPMFQYVSATAFRQRLF